MPERSAPTRRFFVGLGLDQTTRSACAAVAERLRAAGFAARYEAPEKLHITLAFLGNVDDRRYDAITAALLATAARSERFSIAFDKVGGFPHERKPRVVYAGARRQGAAFRALAERVRAAYRDLDFTFEDDAVAHVTVARVKEPGRPLPPIAFEPIVVPVERLTLFESIFDPQSDTSAYRIAKSAPLGAIAMLPEMSI
ncbi:MAG: RNA 2',3'-cyclic phosphodiesterase [Candidatus Baltobacteraceae bacterium]